MSDPHAPGPEPIDPRTADRTLALAGLFQAVHLVQQVARHGLVDAASFETCVGSVLRIDADSVADVYGGLAGLRPGLSVLRDQLGARSGQRDLELTGYVARLLHLERRLAARTGTMRTLREGIERIDVLATSHGAGSEVIVTELAALYVDTVAAVGPRIMVGGEAAHLQAARNAERIRVLLLAGIRAVVLWRQLGGSRLSLLLGRARILRAASSLAARAGLANG